MNRFGPMVFIFALAPLAQAADPPPEFTDPTRPGFVRPAAVGGAPVYRGPELQSTFISPWSRRAIVDGRTYSIGDKFGGAVITDIRPYEVVLQQGKNERRLRMVPKVTQAPTKASEEHEERSNP